jgi:hypothetical protein
MDAVLALARIKANDASLTNVQYVCGFAFVAFVGCSVGGGWRDAGIRVLTRAV